MTRTRRRSAFILLLVGCCIGAAIAIVSGIRGADTDGDVSAAAREALPAARAAGTPAVVYLHTNDPSGIKPGGQLAVARLESAPGRGTLEGLDCDRTYFAAGRGLCLAHSRGFASGYRVRVFDSDLRVQHDIDVPGIPSRARVSPDGRYGAVTFFVTGHAYADPGSFSTQTTLIDLESGQKIANLEDFTVTRAGRQVTAVDVNFWGVTFDPDGDTFYATMATGGKTYLIKGSIKSRGAHTLKENVECPSLSPDGTRLAFKKRVTGQSAPWRLTVLDLATMRETPLAEARSIDDQAEWLDDYTVLYGVDGAIWSVPADGQGDPRRFISGAASPAIVRW